MAKKNYKIEVDVTAKATNLSKATKDLEKIVRLRKKIGEKVDVASDEEIKALKKLLAATEATTEATKKKKKEIS